MADPLRAKFDGLESAPLFDEQPEARLAEPKAPRARNVDRRECPECGQKTGLYVQAVRDVYRRVLAWRRHWRRTNSGAQILCPRSDTQADTPEGT